MALLRAGPRLVFSCSATCSRNRAVYRYYSQGVDGPATPEDCDVVIVGGGPAGLALSSALASSKFVHEKLSVALVEAGDLSKVREWNMPSDAYSNRVSSLTNATQTFLQNIGVWNYVDTSRTCPMEDMQVWDGVSDARIDFNSIHLFGQRSGEPLAMARLTENLNLQRALLRQLSNTKGIQLLDKTKVSTITQDTKERGSWPLVHLSSGKTLRARLLVGADGPNSPVRSFARIQSYGWSYPTQAIVATMRHPPRLFTPHMTAYQRFLPTGPIAFLPLSPTSSSLVWSTKPSLAAIFTNKTLNPEVLRLMINAAFRLPEVSIRYLHQRLLETEAQRPGQPMTADEVREEIIFREQSHNIDPNSAYASASVDPSSANVGIPPTGAHLLPPLVSSIQSGTVASFPLRYNHTESYIGEGEGARTVLVGDAAHTIHPLAGQGLNLGLADVECLARCIEDVVMKGGDIGSYVALAPYARERYFENHKIMSVCDKLHKLYSTTADPIVWARSVGLEVLNELDSIKAAMMMSAGASASSPSGPEGSRQGVGLAGALASGVETAAGVRRFAGDAGLVLRATAASGLKALADVVGRGTGMGR